MTLKSTSQHSRLVFWLVFVCGSSVLALLAWQQITAQVPALSAELAPNHPESQTEPSLATATSSDTQQILLTAEASVTEQSATVVNSTTPSKPTIQRQWSILAQAEIIKTLPTAPGNSHSAATLSPEPEATANLNQTELSPIDAQPPAVLVFASDTQESTPVPSPVEPVSESSDNTTNTVLPELNRQDVIDLVKDWAAAWSQQDIDRYLNFYSQSFAPSKGVTRDVWQQQRQQRISYPQWIKVETSLYDLQNLSTTTATIRFLQHYQSPTLDDRIFKIIGLKLEENEWRIISEHVTKP